MAQSHESFCALSPSIQVLLYTAEEKSDKINHHAQLLIYFPKNTGGLAEECNFIYI